MSKFEVGKKVIAIKDHPQNRFKKGDVFTLKGISTLSCRSSLALDIGMTLPGELVLCAACGEVYNIQTSTFWFLAMRFIPLEEEELKQITFTKIVEQFPIGAN